MTPTQSTLCNECRHFIRTLFSVGKCGRRDPYCPPSIVDERLSGTCLPEGIYFQPKRASAA